MALPNIGDNYKGQVNKVSIGATSESGGTRGTTVIVGGGASTVYAGTGDKAGLKPVIAVDVLDAAPADWPKHLAAQYADVLNDPAGWAKKAVEELGADLVCLKFDSIHPDKGDNGAEHAAKVTSDVLKAVSVPLVLWGCGNDEKDNAVMPKVSGAAKGENCLIGTVTESNYKSLTAIAMADGHNLITEAPLDINIGKQVSILVSDMGFPTERIISFQTTGALGYGIEYSYSIQERQRLATLGGDNMMSTPAICDIGAEAWRAKEAKSEDMPQWGDVAKRGPAWEAATAICLLQGGIDIIRMRHPQAIKTVKTFIDKMYE